MLEPDLSKVNDWISDKIFWKYLPIPGKHIILLTIMFVFRLSQRYGEIIDNNGLDIYTGLH